MAGRVRNLSPWASWMLQLAAVESADPCPIVGPHDLDAFHSWRERAHARLLEMLGPPPEPVPLELETLESEDAGTYRRDRIVFDVEATMSVPAYLLVPHARTAPGPAILAAHGHGAGKSDACDIDDGDPARRAVIDEQRADYAHQLAARGYVVLAPDLRCFGDRADWQPEDHYHCDVNLVHAVMAGRNPLAQNLWDLGRALDVLGEHPLVDQNRLGMVGLSYGGTVTLFLAALDPRIVAAVVSGYFSSWKASHRMPWNMCGSQVLPGILGALEHVDLGAMIAPRPLLIESGSDDDLFPVAIATQELSTLACVYEALGAADRLEHDAFQGGHRWNGTRAYPFLDRHLGHRPPSTPNGLATP